MNKQLVKSALIVVASTGIMASAALACTPSDPSCSTGNQVFSISDITFNPLTDTQGLSWSVTPSSTLTFDLDKGEATTFTYGTFNTRAFNNNGDLSSQELSDTDNLAVSFLVSPPGATNSSTGIVDGAEHWSWFFVWYNDYDYITIDFDNTHKTVAFGNGGSYEIWLNDLTITSNGDSSLTGGMKLLCASSPVPEPTTMLLFGAGALGLAGVARRRKNS